jgi:hypothetical protein
MSSGSTILKERVSVINVNSTQRRLFREESLTSAHEFRDYIRKDDWDDFMELYDYAREISSHMDVRTYQDYAAENDIEIPVVTTQRYTRGAMSGANRDVNPALINLLLLPAVAVPGRSDYESLVNRLNAYVMAGIAHNPDIPWRPFHVNPQGSSIKKLVFCHGDPNRYTLDLPSRIRHVKAIRLKSVELPSTISNINERNNIITLQIRYKADGSPMPLLEDTNIFNFILIKLDRGYYTLDELITHLGNKINTMFREATGETGAPFNITLNTNTGQISILCTNPDLEFHLKFYSQLDQVYPIPLTQPIGDSIGRSRNYLRDLWYMLGFPWPYEVTSSGDDKYTSQLTNLVNVGVHNVLRENGTDIFKRSEESDELYSQRKHLDGGKYESISTFRVYRYPVVDIKYVCLLIDGLKAIEPSNNWFSKVIIDVNRCYTPVECPLIFINAIDRIDHLAISWVDEYGIPVDFCGADHSFTIEFIHYVTQHSTNEFDTGLGLTDKSNSYPLSGRSIQPNQ